MSRKARKILVIAAVVFAIVTPAIQMGLRLGLTPQEFSASGDSTLRAVGYAFSIWGVIYAGLAAYAVWQALARNDGRTVIENLAWPSIVAITGCGLWICASALDWKWASVAIIVVSAATLTLALLREARGEGHPQPLDRPLLWWPLSLLAGWLLAASALNILTVLTAKGLIAPDAAPTAALAGLAIVWVIAVLVLLRTRLIAYGAAVAWALVGVWSAERSDKPDVALVALAGAVTVTLLVVWSLRPTAAPR